MDRRLRGDDGAGDLAKQSGGAYSKVFAGDASVPAAFRLSKKFSLDVSHAKDAKILAAAGKLIEAFLNTIRFGADLSRTVPKHIEIRDNRFKFTGGITALNASGAPGANACLAEHN